jgi:methyl-accepting chemotaxis protein
VSAQPFASGRSFRWRGLVQRSVFGLPAGLVVGLYLWALLEFSLEQWLWLAGGSSLYALFYTGVVQWRVLREGREIADAIDAERAGALSRDQLRRAFAAAVRYPVHGFYNTAATWAGSGLLLPLLLAVRFPDLTLQSLGSVAVGALTGGTLACVFNFFADKRLVAPLRDHWAAQIRDPVERQALVLRVTLGTKLRLAVAGILAVAVVLAMFLADSLAFRPIEAYATRIQTGYLKHMAERVDGPGDPVLQLAREDITQLGIGAGLIVVDLRDGRIVDGEPDALSPAERAWILRGDASHPTSVGIDSEHSFAWRKISTDEDHALVAVVARKGLTGDLTRAHLLFGLLAVLAAGLGLVTAHTVAGDVSATTRRLRDLAERIATGDLTEADPVVSEDELGDLALDFERMSASLRATVGRVAEAAENVEAAAAQMAQVGSAVSAATADQSRALEEARASVGAINREVSDITGSARALSGHVEEAGSSVLELGASGEELKHTAATLNEQVDGVSTSIEQMIRSVRQISSNTEALGGAATDTSSSMGEIAASLRDVDSHVAETARLSSQVVELAGRGRDRVGRTITGMEEIRLATQTVETVIRGLGGRVQEIGAILDVIDDVADETNLLALNAAIIAAQAGDQGRAFSVVADEIAELAERVLSSTKEIGGLIRAVQDESSRATGAIERGAQSVQQGVGLAAEAGLSLDEIHAAAHSSGDRISEIVQAVREQSRAAAHVAELVERVSGGVAQIREAGREQDHGNQVVLRGATSMRDVAQQAQRTTAEQARGAAQIRDSMERVRDAVERIHDSLRQQSDACRRAVSFLEQIHERTRSNEDATRRMSEATRGLQSQAEALRQDVRRFRI